MKDKEKCDFESTVQEIKSIGHMKNNQLKLLEEQLVQEKNQRVKLENDLKEMSYKVSPLIAF